MIPLSKRSFLGFGLGVGLLIALLSSAMMTASVTTAAPATPTVQATLHDNYKDVNPADLGFVIAQTPRYTLQVAGANFVPGARVDMALIDTAALQVVHRSTAYTESKYLGLGLGYDVPNPSAGTFAFQGSFNSTSTTLTTTPHLWCRSTNHLDIHNVTMQ
jgi:hypothetical protein